VDDAQAIGLLGDPLRRQLYDYVAAQDHDVSRAEAAEATGAKRTLVAFHLDKLVEGGLLEYTERRVNGRSGPGAGRPAKLYRRSPVERAVSLPHRDYRTAAEVLTEAAEAVRLDDEVFTAARAQGEALRRSAAERLGAAVAESAEATISLLEQRGYEPHTDRDHADGDHADGDVIRMANCPFHHLAETSPSLICGMNLALLEGLLGDSPHWTVQIEPRPDIGCCTVLRSKSQSD